MHLLGCDMWMLVSCLKGRSVDLIHIPNSDPAWPITDDFECLRNLRKQLFRQPR